MAFLFSLGYIHHAGWIEYKTYIEKTYKETFAFDLITLKAEFGF